MPPCFAKLIIADLMDKYKSIPKRLEEDYHIIKDDTPLVSVYTTRELTVRGMLTSNDLLTDAIRDTQAYKDYVEKFERVDVPFVDTVLLIDDDFGDRLEPESHKENPEKNDDGDEKKDDKKDDDDDNDDDHDDHTLIRTRGIKEKVDEALKYIVPKLSTIATSDLINDNLSRIVANVKFEKSSASVGSCRDDAFPKHDHDEHQGDDAPPEGEKNAKSQKTSKSLKSARGSSSKQPVKETNTSASEQQQKQQDWDA
ncbi:hypothetical protein Tco_1265376 [Tanacetum coccineum]